MEFRFNMTVSIVDYGMGNVASVQKAFVRLGVSHAIVTRDKSMIDDSDCIVLPGVGSFGAGMKNLKTLGLADFLTEQVMVEKKPFLGICLGMQLMAGTGYEPDEIGGLGWVKGSVVKIPNTGKKIPHMGWNDISIIRDTYYKGINSNDFYFIHSYHFDVEEKACVSSMVDYGVPIVSSLEKENLFATQFHPEKSQQAGLTVLKNFLQRYAEN